MKAKNQLRRGRTCVEWRDKQGTQGEKDNLAFRVDRSSLSTLKFPLDFYAKAEISIFFFFLEKNVHFIFTLVTDSYKS